MKFSYKDPSVRLTGRWDVTNPDYAEATATGSYIEFAFEGKMAVAMFNVWDNATPHLHLWIELDGGARFEAPIDSYMRIDARTEGRHICRIIYKGGMESYPRWCRPLRSKVSFIGYSAERSAELPEDNRKTIEFVGDSITEGALIDVDYFGDGEPAYPIDHLCRVYQDDVCATYAWLTAEALDLRPVFMGYGAVGVTKSGHGKVPAAPVAYPYNFDGSPITRPEPDIIMINHGANDRRRPAEEYTEKYGKLLDVIRKLNPHARIVSLSAFCGGHHEELGQFIAEYNEKNGTNVLFIDSAGWISPEPLHPLRDGHATVAEHLAPIIKEIFSL